MESCEDKMEIKQVLRFLQTLLFYQALILPNRYQEIVFDLIMATEKVFANFWMQPFPVHSSDFIKLRHYL